MQCRFGMLLLLAVSVFACQAEAQRSSPNAVNKSRRIAQRLKDKQIRTLKRRLRAKPGESVHYVFQFALVQRFVVPIPGGVRLVQRTVYKPVLVSGLDTAAEQVWQYRTDRNRGFKSMRYRWFVSLVDAQAYYRSIAVRK